MGNIVHHAIIKRHKNAILMKGIENIRMSVRVFSLLFASTIVFAIVDSCTPIRNYRRHVV